MGLKWTLASGLASLAGYRLVPKHPGTRYPPDFEASDLQIMERVAPYTMTSPERLFALIHSVRYVVRNRIPGAIAECGVWRGGSMMAVALALLQAQEVRDLYLYDTFAGMTPPESSDVDHMGRLAETRMQHEEQVRAEAGIEDVHRNLRSTGYPEARIRYVTGPVEATLATDENMPRDIALLRLDTDWYSSTRHEWEHLYPLVSMGGVTIIDDYGYWQGAKKATDEYLQRLTFQPLLCRVDKDARLVIKTSR